MKYSVQQIEEALKSGKTIFFQVPYGVVTEYKANLCPNPDIVVVSWTDKSGRYNDLVYKLMTFIGSFDNGGICTKIEGEETMTNKPHKHAELIKKWADTGCQIQYNVHALAIWIDCVRNNPSWEPDIEYRVKPTLVKKWKWVYESPEGNMIVTCLHYSSSEEFNNLNPYNKGKILQKVDSTMIEVEE